MNGFPIAHVLGTTRDANIAANEFLEKHRDEVKNWRKDHATYRLELVNGDVHFFMSDKVFGSWLIGRTYYRNGSLYHSGYEAVK